MSLLLAGPWIGEFGWELFQFQAYVRAMAKNFDEVIVSSRTGNGFLYEDFVDLYIPYDPKGIHAECDLLLDHDRDNDFYNSLILRYRPTKWLQPNETTKNNPAGQGIPSYFKYGDRDTTVKTIDVVIHARQARKRGDMQAHRNWNQEYLEDLVKVIPTNNIAFIGKTGDCGFVEGFKDYRDVSLKDLSAIFDKSKVLLGSSSGPMHFGSLCGIPHIVTFGAQDGAFGNHERYQTLWNPFNTAVQTIGDAWSPPLTLIVKALEKWL